MWVPIFQTWKDIQLKKDTVLLCELFLFAWILRLLSVLGGFPAAAILATHFCAFLYFCTRTSIQYFQFGCEDSTGDQKIDRHIHRKVKKQNM